MREYVQIGNDMLQDFYRQWESRFQKLQDESQDKVDSLQLEHEEQMDMLNQKLDRAVEAAKIKPAAKLREMQNNEKLVAVNERVEEAMNYRKELKNFEVQEAERVHMLKEKNAQNQRNKLLTGQVSFSYNDPFAEKGNGSSGGQD